MRSKLYYYPAIELHFYIRFMRNCQALPILLGHHGISVLMESAGPGGILFMCLHFVYWMQMNAFLAFQNLLGLSNMGLNVCT